MIKLKYSTFLLLFAALSVGFTNAQTINEKLVGVWQLTGHTNDSGEALPKQENSNISVLELNANNLGTIHYTPKSKEDLMWKYDAAKNSIVFQNKVDPSTFGGRYLIKNNIAKLINGYYWDELSEKLISVDDNKLVIQELKNRNKVYKRAILSDSISIGDLWTMKDKDAFVNIMMIRDNAPTKTIEVTQGNDKRTYEVDKEGSKTLVKDEQIYKDVVFDESVYATDSQNMNEAIPNTQTKVESKPTDVKPIINEQKEVVVQKPKAETVKTEKEVTTKIPENEEENARIKRESEELKRQHILLQENYFKLQLENQKLKMNEATANTQTKVENKPTDVKPIINEQKEVVVQKPKLETVKTEKEVTTKIPVNEEENARIKREFKELKRQHILLQENYIKMQLENQKLKN